MELLMDDPSEFVNGALRMPFEFVWTLPNSQSMVEENMFFLICKQHFVKMNAVDLNVVFDVGFNVEFTAYIPMKKEQSIVVYRRYNVFQCTI